ncbi:MAG: hypothetical protein KJ069_02160 [Anaerolineae bacterium]|nr:hypothetical protein [Anaerolineae bacterium]
MITFAALVLLSVTAFAAPPKPAAGPFEGVFTGTVTGDLGSQTTLTLDLTDRANLVAGEATLGTGLKVNAGQVCGTAVVPAGVIWAEGEKSPRRPRELSAESTIEVSGMEVTVEVDGELSADGKTLDVTAKIDTPWICGRDPVITGTLTKV